MTIQGSRYQIYSAVPLQSPSVKPIVVISGLNAADQAVVFRVARQLGAGTAIGPSAIQRRIWTDARNKDILVVDLDLLGDIDSAVDTLIDFRHKFPNVHVIAISRDFSADDRGRERRAIADHCLKSPLSEARVAESLMDFI